jgi:hypothetical protein
VWLGAYLLKFLNPLYLEIIMGLFLISNLPFIFKQPESLRTATPPTNNGLLLIGFLAGFLSGLTGAVGLLFNKFYLRYGLTKEEIIATRAANEITLHLIKIILYAFFGLLSMKVFAMGAVVAASALLSTWTITYVLPKLSEFAFRKIGYGAMVISGILMLGQSTKDLFSVNQGSIATTVISKGLETKLQWQHADFALEFTYDEGFEFELSVPITELTAAQQQLVANKRTDADKIIIEVVYSFEETSYEAYYFKNHQLLEKFDFE